MTRTLPCSSVGAFAPRHAALSGPAGGRLDLALARGHGPGATRPRPQRCVHPAVDERRPQPDGYVRSEAGPRERRQRSRKSPPACRASRSRSTCPSWPRMAEHLAIIRSMSTKEGDHGRATYLLRNGYLPQPPVRYPTLGSLVAKELGDPTAELPSFVSIAPFRNFNPAAFSPASSARNTRRCSSAKPATTRTPATTVPRRRSDRGRSGCAVEASPAKRSTSGSACSNWLNDRFVSTPRRTAGHRLQDRLRAGRAADAQPGGQGVRPGRRAGRSARRLRPQSFRPGLPARAPAGRAGRAVCRSHARRRRHHRLGHAHRQLRRRQRT